MGKFKLPESGQKMWNDAVKIVMLVFFLNDVSPLIETSSTSPSLSNKPNFKSSSAINSILENPASKGRLRKGQYHQWDIVLFVWCFYRITSMIKIIAETRVPKENYEAFATLAAPLVAAQQLRDLERSGFLLRKVYPVVPPKVEYSLSTLSKTIS